MHAQAFASNFQPHMHLQPGIFIRSKTAALEDQLFGDAIVFITEYNSNGTMGFIINKKFHRRFNELLEFADAPALELWLGGPMENEKLYFVHCRPDIIEESIALGKGIYYGGNFNQAVNALKQGKIEAHHIRLFIGYCGWDYLQLENEMKQGEWIISNAEEWFSINRFYSI